MTEERYMAVHVSQLVVSKMGFVLLLKSDEDLRSLPIFIGTAEAQSIALHLGDVKVPRPLTHDLIRNLFDLLDCRLKRVEVCRLEAGTFYARLALDREGSETAVDARPSDAIAIALRAGAPIFVAASVMDEAGQLIEEVSESEPSETGPAEQPEPEPAKPRRKPSPVEVLKRKLDLAVKQERYEDAARYRDEIARLEHTHTDN